MLKIDARIFKIDARIFDIDARIFKIDARIRIKFWRLVHLAAELRTPRRNEDNLTLRSRSRRYLVSDRKVEAVNCRKKNNL
jgi:hypothetical protein